MKILVIEDEKKIASFIRKGLEAQGFVVDISHHGDEGFIAATTRPYDAIVLDIMQGELENALQEAAPGSREQRLFVGLLDETQRLKTITGGLLMLARADAGQLKPAFETVNFTAILEGILEDTRLIAEETRLSFEVELAPGVTVCADPVSLRTALAFAAGSIARASAALGATALPFAAGLTSAAIVFTLEVLLDVLVAQGDAHDALAQEHGQLVLDEKGIAVIGETSGELLAETADRVHFPQQQRAALAGQMPAAEIRFDPAAAKPLKCEGLLFTLCLALGGVHASFFGLRIKG